MATFRQVLDHFGGPTALAKALRCSPAAVSQWGGVIPERRVHQIAYLSKGRFSVEDIDRLAPKKRRAA